MISNPLVSILIPTYNRANYLCWAIDSALAQTYRNIEIIVHDDASTDDTPQILTKYRSNPRIRLIRTRTNHSMIGGWNYIQSKAKGEYIKFLGSDDLLEPNCVSELIRAMTRYPQASLITSRRKFIDQDGKIVKTLGFGHKDMVVDGPEHAHWILTSIRENKIGEPAAVLYRTKLVKQAGGFDPTFSQFADFEYWLRLLQFGDLVYVHKSLCSFRSHESSNTSAAVRDGRFITEIFELIDKYYDNPHYAKIFGLTDKNRNKVTRQKILDTIKNIKDLIVAGYISQAYRYSRRLSRVVSFSYMIRIALVHILQ